MIHSKELQIGDWVYNQHHKKPIQITPYDFFIHSHIGDTPSFEGILHLKPTLGRDLDSIPLTEEILENNGFKKFESKTCAPIYYTKGIALRWHCYGKYFYINSDDVDIRITEVHQFQHALRLCGLNELADNLKVK